MGRLPAPDSLGRDVERLAHLLERDHRLGRLIDRQSRQRPIESIDQEPQIVPQIVARNPQVRVSIRAVLGHAEADELIRVHAARIDLAQKPGGAAELFAATSRRSEPHLLVG